MIEILPNWHPFFVHFTIAIFIVSIPFYFTSIYSKEYTTRYQTRITARWLNWIATAASVATVGAGIYAYYTVDHDTPSHVAMTAHRNWAIVTFIFLATGAVWSALLAKRRADEPKAYLGLIAVTLILLLVTGWKGGELVYRYGLGVMALPVSEGPGHSHDHGDGHDHSDETTPSAPRDDLLNGEPLDIETPTPTPAVPKLPDQSKVKNLSSSTVATSKSSDDKSESKTTRSSSTSVVNAAPSVSSVENVDKETNDGSAQKTDTPENPTFTAN